MNRDEIFMQRCIELASLGIGLTYPNPMVGSVVVYNGSIIGEGWHQKAGGNHAEVNAILAVKDTSLLKNSTLYVNLEPCSHHGKTPPCVDFIIKHKIPRVVIGCIDPFALVFGKGIDMLKNAGKEVLVGVLEKECRYLNKRFFTFQEKKRPYIILKWAQSKNGFIAPMKQEFSKPFWITNKKSQILSHKWRTEESAILVGTNTAEKDNPSLTARLWEGKNPLRLVIDRQLRLKKMLNIFDGNSKTFVFTDKIKRSTKYISYIKLKFDCLPSEIINTLFKKNIQSVIVEGGNKTIQAFIDLNLWDEARVFSADVIIKNGVKSPKINAKPVNSIIVDDNQLHYFYK